MSSQAIPLAPGTPTQSGSPLHAWRRHLSLENRFVPPIFITLILVVGHFSFGILESWQRTLLAIATAIGVELLLGRTLVGRWPHLASAYISGISVGILLRAPGYWPYVLAAALSITSKYVLRWRNRHLWNPSNFGICALLFLAAESVTTLSIQWGNNLAAMAVIWVLGSLIIWRARRFHICATYVLSFLAYSLVRAHLVHDPWLSEVAPLTGPEYQLFTFFMITDPRTTVRGWRGQCLVAFLVASVEMALRLHQVIYAPLYALFLVGPPALAFDLWWHARQRPATVAA